MGNEEYRPKDDVVFYFNKEQMDKNRHRRVEVPKKSRPFRDNKTLLIILLDIGIIVLFALVIVPLMRKPYKINNFEGYSVSLSAFRTGEKTYAAIHIRNKMDKDKDSPGGELGEVVFYGSEMITSGPVTIILPEPGEQKVFDYTFKTNTLGKVYVQLKTGQNSTILRVKVLF